jgi:hypothetical protein
MKCALKSCGSEIPIKRKKTARYCSGACYYEAKKNRSNARYAILKVPITEIKRSEKILEFLHQTALLKKNITGDDLKAMNFNFGISTGEYLYEGKKLYKVIGDYAYYLDRNNNLEIWKSTSRK